MRYWWLFMDAFRQRIMSPIQNITIHRYSPSNQFLNNESLLYHIGSRSIWMHPRVVVVFSVITPSCLPDNVHIVMLSHFDGETLYLVRCRCNVLLFWEWCLGPVTASVRRYLVNVSVHLSEEADDTPSITVITIPHDMEPQTAGYGLLYAMVNISGPRALILDLSVLPEFVIDLWNIPYPACYSCQLTSPERLFSSLWDPFTGHRCLWNRIPRIVYRVTALCRLCLHL